MIDFTLSPPAIIECQEVQEISFGLSYATSRTELDKFIIPRDWKDATLEEIRAYIPHDLRDMPPWAIQSMFPLFARSSGKKLIKTTVFLLSTSGSNQTWNVLSDWNSAENIVHVIGGGGNGAGIDGGSGEVRRGGGGGGAYANKANISLTPGASATFFIGPASFGFYDLLASPGANGATNWFGGTTSNNALVRAAGGNGGNGSNGGSGGSSFSSAGDTRYSGGTGRTAASATAGGGGGAGGPGGAGQAGQAPANNFSAGGAGGNGAGGSGGSLFSVNGGAGTEFQVSPARGSGGGGGAVGGSISGTGAKDGGHGGNYGGGGGGASRRSNIPSPNPNANGGRGAQGIIVIINNHINGV